MGLGVSARQVKVHACFRLGSPYMQPFSVQAKLDSPDGKRLAVMQEARVRSLGWEDPLEKEMAIHSSTIAWKIPWTEEPSRLQPMGSQRVEHD